MNVLGLRLVDARVNWLMRTAHAREPAAADYSGARINSTTGMTREVPA